ncbi:MAG: tryptophan 2,3-dioxygenase [Anaerolineales bacterium]|jgi:tryptophan 2,3-dioxygenase|uniref:tryptophan 2,3-dioxygenase family protein n=1 Tax=Candidatus Villigracilis vicinus TaxID=3140679 RepID=UPI00313602AF|nr:tryptophan 2,3-dioxygenase [Anaerolineales bacterium]
MSEELLYYTDYLELDKILGSQHPKSNEQTDEMLFIIIHQAYELWFKMVIHELDQVRRIFDTDNVLDNAGEMSIAVQKLKRVVKIFEVVNRQVDILESMTPMDFLEFRDLLVPSSGFQSLQFRIIEAKLGLKMDQRYKSNYYKNTRPGGFNQRDYDAISSVESEATLKGLVMKWAERTPFFDEALWRDFQSQYPLEEGEQKFWSDYKQIYKNSLSGSVELRQFDELERIFYKEGLGEFSVGAMRAVLFIMMYRNLPIFQQPFDLLSTLIDIDEMLSQFRYKHMLMARRMIGMRSGTGGTSGAGYLEGALRQHYIFKELTEVSTFLVERSHLPSLPKTVKEKTSFNV